MREAIGLMFNFEWSNETLFYGLYERTDSFFENSPMKAEGLPRARSSRCSSRSATSCRPRSSPSRYSPPVNGSQPDSDRAAIRQASKLLDEAGWTVGAGGKNAQGRDAEILFIDDTGFERIINPYVENLRRIGIDASYAASTPRR